jgi:hypothetical protein
MPLNGVPKPVAVPVHAEAIPSTRTSNVCCALCVCTLSATVDHAFDARLPQFTFPTSVLATKVLELGARCRRMRRAPSEAPAPSSATTNAAPLLGRIAKSNSISVCDDENARSAITNSPERVLP